MYARWEREAWKWLFLERPLTCCGKDPDESQLDPKDTSATQSGRYNLVTYRAMIRCPRQVYISLHYVLFVPANHPFLSIINMSADTPQTTTPGNAYSDRSIEMRTPSMKFIYRLECEMAKDDHVVGAQIGTSNTRVIMPIIGGTVKGPKISAVIEHMSGADWGLVIGRTGVSHKIRGFLSSANITE